MGCLRRRGYRHLHEFSFGLWVGRELTQTRHATRIDTSLRCETMARKTNSQFLNVLGAKQVLKSASRMDRMNMTATSRSTASNLTFVALKNVVHFPAAPMRTFLSMSSMSSCTKNCRRLFFRRWINSLCSFGMMGRKISLARKLSSSKSCNCMNYTSFRSAWVRCWPLRT